jgi:FkbM family methyltransferase
MKKIIRKILNKFGYDIKKIDYKDDPNFLLCKFLNKYKVNCFLDIGANIGQTALALRNNNYKEKIISFEPQSAAHKYLINISKKDKKWQIFERCAIGESNEIKKIKISSNSVSSSFLNFSNQSIELSKDLVFIGEEEVNVYKLNDVLKKIRKEDLNSIFFLKIDVQGMEQKIISSSQDILNQFLGLSCELPITSLYEGDENFLYTINFLKKNGFEIYSIYNSVFDHLSGKTYAVDITFINKKILK